MGSEVSSSEYTRFAPIGIVAREPAKYFRQPNHFVLCLHPNSVPETPLLRVVVRICYVRQQLLDSSAVWRPMWELLLLISKAFNEP